MSLVTEKTLSFSDILGGEFTDALLTNFQYVIVSGCASLIIAELAQS
jgi:hypothetical protein